VAGCPPGSWLTALPWNPWVLVLYDREGKLCAWIFLFPFSSFFFFFQIGSHTVFCLGWPQTAVLLHSPAE
jgi:hypothetical protein